MNTATKYMTIAAESYERRARNLDAAAPTIATGALAADAKRAADIVYRIESKFAGDDAQLERHTSRMTKCIEFAAAAARKSFDLVKREHGLRFAQAA